MSKLETPKIIARKCVVYGDFIFASGKRSDNKIEMDNVPHNSHEEDKVVEEIDSLLRFNPILPSTLSKGHDVVVFGVPSGAERFAKKLAEVRNFDFARILNFKESLKDPSKEMFIEGTVRPYRLALLLDDVFSTAGSWLRCAEFLKTQNFWVLDAIGIVDREEGNARENLFQQGYKLYTITTKSEVFQYV